MRRCAKPWPRLAQVVPELAGAGKSDVPSLVRRHLDTLDSDGRWAFLKLLTGGLRVGVSTRSAKLALAAYSHRVVEDIEEVWHSQTPPYTELFEWLDEYCHRNPQQNLSLATEALFWALRERQP